MYLMRLDDATEHWNIGNWERMHDLLAKYSIHPIVAIIPKNEDSLFMQFPKDDKYIDKIRQWIKEGWTPALHGFNHVLEAKQGGVNPINMRSEFAGLPLVAQRKKIRSGITILNELGISPEIFVAPAHTFDENTLEAIRQESKIRVISDTIAFDSYCNGDFYFIPQQSGMVRRLPFPLVTFCYHPNTMTDNQFASLEDFLDINAKEFTSFGKFKLRKRSLNLLERIYRLVYFTRRKHLIK